MDLSFGTGHGLDPVGRSLSATVRYADSQPLDPSVWGPLNVGRVPPWKRPALQQHPLPPRPSSVATGTAATVTVSDLDDPRVLTSRLSSPNYLDNLPHLPCRDYDARHPLRAHNRLHPPTNSRRQSKSSTIHKQHHTQREQSPDEFDENNLDMAGRKSNVSAAAAAGKNRNAIARSNAGNEKVATGTAKKGKGGKKNKSAAKQQPAARRASTRRAPVDEQEPYDSDATHLDDGGGKQKARRQSKHDQDQDDGLDDDASFSGHEGDESTEDEEEEPHNPRARGGRIRAPLPDDQLALQAQLDETRQKNATLEDQLKHEQEHRGAIAASQVLVIKNEVKLEIDKVVKTHVFHTCKFITNDNDLDSATRFIMKKLAYDDGKSEEYIASWVLTYRRSVSKMLCNKRNYAQSQMRIAILAYARNVDPPVVAAGENAAPTNHVPGWRPIFSEDMMERVVLR